MKRLPQLLLPLLALAAVVSAAPPRDEARARTGYVPLAAPLTIRNGTRYSDAGTEWVALVNHGVPADAAAVVVKVSLTAPNAGTAAWVSHAPSPNGGPTARVQVAGGFADAASPTALLLTDSGPLAAIAIGRSGPCQVWVYVLGYYV